MFVGTTQARLYLGGPRLLELRLLLRPLLLFGVGLKLFLRGFWLFLRWWVSDDISQHVCQRDDPEQAPLPSAAPFVFFSLNDDQPMDSALVYQLEKCSEGV